MPKKNKISFKLGFMQGRLSNNTAGRLQSFPWKNWPNEFYLSKFLPVNSIEWTLDYHNIFKNPLLDKKQWRKIISLSKKNKIKVDSLTCDFFMQKFFLHNNNKKKILKIFDQIFNASKLLRLKYIVVPLVDKSSVKSKKDLKKIINFFCDIHLRNKNNTYTKILFETDFPPQKQFKFINSFPIERFGINYDTGNSAHNGFNLFDEFKAYGKYIENIHIKDRLFKGKSVRLGNGDFNFLPFFDLLKNYNYNGNLILQTAKSIDHINELRENIKYLTKIINENT